MHEAPFSLAATAAPAVPAAQATTGIEPIREALFDCMWQDVGILRDAAGLQRALAKLDELDARLAATGVPGDDRAFNLCWHDWLNLRNLIAVGRVIARSALAREDSRGAHYREDFPASGDLDSSACLVVRQDARGELALQRQRVRFTRVRPGQSLIDEPAVSAVSAVPAVA